MSATADTPIGTDPGEEYRRIRGVAFSGAKALAVRYVLVAVLSLVGSTVLIRMVGPAEWASYTIAYYLISFLDQNLATRVLGKLVASKAEPDHADIDSAVWLMNVVGVLLLVLALALSAPIESAYGGHHLGECLAAVGICGFVYAQRSTSSALLERSMEYRSIGFADVMDQVTFYIIGLTLVGLGYGITGIAWALAARGVFAALLLRRRRPTPLLGRFHRERIRALVGFGGPSLITGLVIMLDGLVAPLVLGGAHAVQLAFFMTSATIVGYGLTVAAVSQRVSFPGLASLHRQGDQFDLGMSRVLSVTMATVISMIAPLAVTAPFWLPALLGARWHAAAQVMIIVAAGLVVASFVQALSFGLASLGQASEMLRINLAMTLAYLGMAFALVSWSPILACPVAYLAARVLGLPVALWGMRRNQHPVRWGSQLARLALGTGAILGIGLLAYEEEWVAALLTGAAVLAVWLRLVHRDLLALARGVLRRDVAVSRPRPAS